MELTILGEGHSHDEIKMFLARIDLKTYQNADGKWVSPINGDEFDDYFAMAGHLGSKLRSIKLTEIKDNRAGYVKALRRGKEPTEAQRRAHKEYMRELRRVKRAEAQ